MMTMSELNEIQCSIGTMMYCRFSPFFSQFTKPKSIELIWIFVYELISLNLPDWSEDSGSFGERNTI